MAVIDLKKELKEFYAPSRELEIVTVPKLTFVMVDGEGDPNVAPLYPKAIEWLYSVSYAMKFASKAAGKDYGVPPLEGLWWADDMDDFITRRKDRWKWTLMILVPDWVTRSMFDAAVAKASKKLGASPATLRFDSYEEGLSVQVLHVGSYDDEGSILERLHKAFLPANGLVEAGLHHEIYLSDARRVAAAKLRTVLRQPVKPNSSRPTK
jgi:hypothetical protein